MAIYTKPVLQPRILGSRTGATFQRTANGFVIRKRVIPVDKKSDIQTTKRNSLASIQSNHKNLSAPDLTTWINEAPNYPRTNSLGAGYNLSGPQLYTSSNRNLEESELAGINSIPAATAFPVINSSSNGVFVYVPSALFSTSPNIIPAGYHQIIYASQALPEGLKYPGISDLRIIAVMLPGESNTIDFFAAYAAAVPILDGLAPMSIWTAWQYVEIATGQRGNLQIRRGPFLFVP